MTIQQALMQGRDLLAGASIAEPRINAEVLLLRAIRLEVPVDRAWLYAHGHEELRELWWIHYGRYLHQRMSGKPTQYITGVQEFYGRDFRVTPDVLIPRPETEHLVERALALSRAHGLTRIVDIGTGSGAIAASLSLELSLPLVASDLSPAAIAVAQSNARQLGAEVTCVCGDLTSMLRSESLDLLVTNPPYVPLRDQPTMQKEVRDHEPSLALFAGDDGLEVYSRLIPDAWRVLRTQGWLVMELGQGSRDAVGQMLRDWIAVETVNDLAGIPRVIAAKKPS